LLQNYTKIDVVTHEGRDVYLWSGTPAISTEWSSSIDVFLGGQPRLRLRLHICVAGFVSDSWVCCQYVLVLEVVLGVFVGAVVTNSPTVGQKTTKTFSLVKVRFLGGRPTRIIWYNIIFDKIAPLRESSPQKHSGMTRVLKGFHSFTCTSTLSLAIGMTHTCLCLPSYSWYSFTDPRRDGQAESAWVAGYVLR